MRILHQDNRFFFLAHDKTCGCNSNKESFSQENYTWLETINSGTMFSHFIPRVILLTIIFCLIVTNGKTFMWMKFKQKIFSRDEMGKLLLLGPIRC